MAKILLIAPTCDGQDVGEAWVAFQWAQRLAERHDVTLLTYHKRGRTPASEQLSGLRVVEWTEPPLLGRKERLNSMLKPAYPWFYVRARQWIRTATARGEHFDVAHQPTPVAMRYPSPASGAGLPLVIGPVGGGLSSPPGFAADYGTSPWYLRLRQMDGWRIRHDPLLRATYSQAACVLGIAPYVKDLLDAIPIRRFEVMSETGLQSLPAPISRSEHPGPVRLLYVGRLVRTKGARDIIRAIDSVHDLSITLDIIGDGPDRGACQLLVEQLKLPSRVNFRGTLPRDEVDGYYRRADIFVFPSYREPGGNVVPEAMGFGLPLIVADRGGPGAATNDDSAIRLAVSTPQALVDDLAAAIRRLVEDANLRARMGAQARARVRDYGMWQSKMDQIDAVFRSVRRPPSSLHNSG